MTEQLPPDLRWISFDLDDTLHYFKRASTRASEAVFLAIEQQFGVGNAELSRDSAAMKVDLATLGQLLDQLPRTNRREGDGPRNGLAS